MKYLPAYCGESNLKFKQLRLFEAKKGRTLGYVSETQVEPFGETTRSKTFHATVPFKLPFSISHYVRKVCDEEN
jgi:hypothetical protein